MMRKWLAFFLLVALAGALGGCAERSQQGVESPVPLPRSPGVISNQRAVIATATSASPIEEAHQSYLRAYENYVKMLRESGPQTMETLIALADYQKRYQIYQMLLGADKSPTSQGTPEGQ